MILFDSNVPKINLQYQIYPLIVYDSDGNYNIEIKNMFGDDAHDTK